MASAPERNAIACGFRPGSTWGARGPDNLVLPFGSTHSTPGVGVESCPHGWLLVVLGDSSWSKMRRHAHSHLCLQEATLVYLTRVTPEAPGSRTQWTETETSMPR